MKESESEFPKIINGSCDGLGCGRDVVPCWCDESTDSHEEFQRRFDRQWHHEWTQEGKANGCDIWHESLSYTFDRFKEYNKKIEENYKRDADYATRVIGERNETISILCDKIEDDEEEIDELQSKVKELDKLVYKLSI